MQFCVPKSMTTVELEQILYRFNDTDANYSQEQTIHQLFEVQVDRTPSAVAVKLGDQKVTYQQLNQRANQLARILRERGIGPESIVALLVERSIDMIIGILGILKAGGAYLPIDPNYPQDRIEYMLNDSQATLLLSHSYVECPIFTNGVLWLDDASCYATDGGNLETVNTPDHLAYVIYTSGSTGNPKGVMTEHRNVVRLMMNDKMPFSFSEHDVWTMFHSFCFDFSVWEMYGALLYGGLLVLVPKRVAQDPVEFLALLKQENVTILNQTPGSFYNLMNVESTVPDNQLSLRYVVFGGEALKPVMLSKFKEKYPETKLINMYGITEITVHATFKEITQKEIDMNISNIGKPLPTLRMYVMNDTLEVLPIGETGELFVSGAGVARGYLNRQELTDERFINNPFVPGERMYRSGDLAKWLPDGTMVYLGRKDHQVKIRGYRIEIGEIEHQLATHEQIQNVSVLDREDQMGNKILCGYIVSDRPLHATELRKFLERSLPTYMIPSHFIQVESIPLTSNGKVDRNGLPAPDVMRIDLEYVAARNELEKQLVSIWQGVLGLNQIGVSDSFMELGGHSLHAASITMRLRKEFGVNLAVQDILSHPTIEELSLFLRSANTDLYEPIPTVDDREWYPTSSSQKRMFFLHHQLGQNQIYYNVPQVLRVEGVLNRANAKRAWQLLVDRHEALRTNFQMVEGELKQKIQKRSSVSIACRTVHSEDGLNELIQQFIRPFDLSQSPLLRVEFIEVATDEHYMLIDMHHIVSDGISVALLIREWIDLYQGHSLPELRVQYKEYAVWQHHMAQSQAMQEHREYWLQQYPRAVPTLELPTDYPRPSVQHFEGATLDFAADSDLWYGLKRLMDETGTTPHMVLMAAFAVLLARYSRQEEIVVGLPIAGRTHPDVESVVGMFVNTLAIRNHPSFRKSYREFLMEVKDTSFQAYKHQDYPFEELVESLQLVRDRSHHPMFNVMFTMQNMSSLTVRTELLSCEPYPFDKRVARFDLVLYAYLQDEKLTFELEYATALFTEETVQRMADHLMQILRETTQNPDVLIGEIDMVSIAVKHRIFNEFNNTKSDYPEEQLIAQLFEEQVRAAPDQVAIVHGEQQVTYRELNEKANRLARMLRTNGVKSDCVVGIMLEKSIDMIVAVVAVVKSGGAYLPIDPDYPSERIEYMFQNSDARVLLTTSEWIKEIKFAGQVIDVQEVTNSSESEHNLDMCGSPQNLAYIMYTSGSTGLPKGVMVEQRSIIRLVKSTNYVDLQPEDRVLMTGTFVFDACTFEIWGSLLNGTRLYLIEKETLLDASGMARVLETNQITHALITTPLFNQLSQENPNMFRLLHTLIIGGDVASPRHVKRVREACPKITLINAYGPTENTTISTSFTIKKDYDRKIPIGKPIANSTAFVVNSITGKLEPIGVVGELWLGGDGVARGYVNNQELTEKQFVANPFMPGERLYRTGDLAKWLTDGNIEFVGRIDTQVKIRGFRIEIPEIEHILTAHQSVQETVVLVHESDTGHKDLCAYFVADGPISAAELRSYLSEKLPEYMIPLYYVQLSHIPLTNNGKVDNRSLPKPNPKIPPSVDLVLPQNDLERRIFDIWREVLGVHEFGVTDSFFALGGHSLKVTTLAAKLLKTFKVEVSIKDIFERDTVREIANLIADTENSPFAPIEIVEEQEYYPVSSPQKRLFILDQIASNKLLYNIPIAMKIDGVLHRERFAHCLQSLVNRHEALRTCFAMVNGQPMQRVHLHVDIPITYSSVSNEQVEDAIQQFIRSFDLTQKPLLRVEMLVLAEDEHVLLLDMHHVISDGVSVGILIRELIELYMGRELPEQRVQYKDFSVWQLGMMNSQPMAEHEKFWMEKFTDEIPVLQLPTDYPRQSVQQSAGQTLVFTGEQELLHGLKRMTSETGTTLYMALMAAFFVMIAKYSRQEDIVVGSPIAGRTHPDTENIIGMFVNTLAIRAKPSTTKTFREFLIEIKEIMLQAFVHQEYQFEELVEKLNVQRDVGRNPIFNVMFSMNNMGIPDLQTNELSIRPHQYDYPFSKFDLTLFAEEKENELRFLLEYSTALYKRHTMESMCRHYLEILRTIIYNPEALIRDITMITSDERQQLIQDFNNTNTPYSSTKLIHQLFEEQVDQLADQIAVDDGTTRLTYLELNKRSNQLAVLLRKLGIAKGQFVAVMMDRSVHVVVATLAVLKSGGAYVPLDPSWPDERVQTILSSLHVPCVIIDSKQCPTSERLVEKVPSLKDVILLGEPNFEPRFEGHSFRCTIWTHAELTVLPADNLSTGITSEALAYIIFTSGSTGTPKGVMVKHKPVINLIEWGNKTFSVNSTDKVLFITSLCFDLSVYDMFGLLAAGGTIRIASSSEVRNPKRLLEIIDQERITFWDSAPAAMQQVAHFFPQYWKSRPADLPNPLRLVFLSGDWIPVQLPDQLTKTFAGSQVISLGGATEATIWSNYFSIDHVDPAWTSIPYGKPIQNARYYILDENMVPCPIGVPGDLYIGGQCLSSGYVNTPELTNQRFIPNPFASPSELMYMTGDMAKWLPDGNMEFLGRLDNQVKIRGYRIDLGEIEYHLMRHAAIKEALVIAIEGPSGMKYLCSYVVADASLTSVELRQYLASKLPEYMIPSLFVRLDQIPVTSNGKVDRKSLPEPKPMDNRIEQVPPRNDVETALLEIWKSVLQIQSVGIDENFFAIGGNSLLLLRLYDQITSQFFGELKLVDLFAYPTIALLAQKLTEPPPSEKSNAEEQITDIFDRFENGDLDFDQAIQNLIDMDV
ncbi:amino acid adenylation domain-containing protein [Alicyclobacillus fodiniaquatilis]|uniref:Amino acid adenylation domain-containing protein n=1 Tax=Alicyclobacillus fodiniaquatilis TaxID=1661150 RepID=A0ABW4JJH3_9BACL